MENAAQIQTFEQLQAAELRTLYKRDAAASAVLDYFASSKRNITDSFIDKVSLATKVSYSEVIRVMRELESLGFGTFRNGRKGHKSRMVWDANIISIGAIAKGEEAPADIAMMPDDIVHSFTLRQGHEVHFTLPADLSEKEASRLAAFIGSLPF